MIANRRRGLWLDRRGASAVEYALILVAILLLVGVGYRLLGKGNSDAARVAEGHFHGSGETLGGAGGSHGSGTGSGGNGSGGEGTQGTSADDPAGGAADPSGDTGDAPEGPSATASAEGGGSGGDHGGDKGGAGGGGGGFWGGVGKFFKGAVLGDFGGDNGWPGLAGQVVVGFIPIVGQIGDVRDTVAGIKAVATGEPGGWGQLGGAAVAWVPGVGDLAKAGLKGARHADEAAEGAAKATDEAAQAGTKVASRADATRLIDESEGRQFGNNTGHARAHVPREGEDAAHLAESRRKPNGNPYQNNTVFRTGRHGEQALRDIMNERADDLANLRPGDPAVEGTHRFQNTVEGLNSQNGGPAQRVQIREATYAIVRLPDGKLHLIHFAPRQ